jgi:hypothetical protein
MALHETSLVSDNMIILNRMAVVLLNGSFKIVAVGLVLRFLVYMVLFLHSCFVFLRWQIAVAGG